MEDLIIRRFEAEDRQQVAALMASSFRDDWLKIVSLPDDKLPQFLIETGEILPYPFEGYMVAEEDGDILGMIKLKWVGQARPKFNPRTSRIFQYGFVPAVKLLVMRYFFPENPEKGACHVSEIAVSEKARRKGIATEMLLFGKKLASGKGLNKYTLNVDDDNKAAFNLYRKMGFTIEKSRRNLLAKWLLGTDKWHFMSQPIDGSE